MNESTPEFVTVSEAAAILKVSERTIRRRCETGKLTARLDTTATGKAWLIEAAAIGQPAVTSAAKAAEPADVAAHSERSAEYSAPVEPAAMPADGADVVRLSRQLEAIAIERERDREEISFLRGLVEQRDRDNAETRAALREALKAMPKAITEGTSTLTTLTPKKEPNAPAENRAGQEKSTPDVVTTQGEKPKAQKSRKREIRPFQRAVARLLGIRLGEVE